MAFVFISRRKIQLYDKRTRVKTALFHYLTEKIEIPRSLYAPVPVRSTYILIKFCTIVLLLYVCVSLFIYCLMATRLLAKTENKKKTEPEKEIN